MDVLTGLAAVVASALLWKWWYRPTADALNKEQQLRRFGFSLAAVGVIVVVVARLLGW